MPQECERSASVLSGLLVFTLCVVFCLCQDQYSGYHSEYPPEPTHSYDQEQRPHQQEEEEEEDDYYGGPYGPTRVTMITEESFPYATTAEAHYAKEDQETMEVPYDTGSSEESGGDAALGEEGPTDCDCEPGEPGFAGFAGPKGSRGVRGKTGEPGAQGREEPKASGEEEETPDRWENLDFLETQESQESWV
ncbi:hypothetical protein INR49_020424 [Caranx melampygus]|nr:hypothetical protein INR49_020424 [Caranx melampygus]